MKKGKGRIALNIFTGGFKWFFKMMKYHMKK